MVDRHSLAEDTCAVATVSFIVFLLLFPFIQWIFHYRMSHRETDPPNQSTWTTSYPGGKH